MVCHLLCLADRKSYRPEAYSAADKDPITGKPLDVGIHDIETPGNAKKQDGFFHKGLLQAMESDNRGASSAREVKVLANGHSHGQSFS